jgi:predicted amidophosphoribosyltransferase
MCNTRKHRPSNWNNQRSQMAVSEMYLEEMSPLINEGFFYCFNCGQTFNFNEVNYCDHCGFEIQVCPISRNKFKIGDDFAQCPKCSTIFHYHHLINWLQNNNRCPNCQEQLDSILRGKIGRNQIKIS